jgi:trigger factor
MQVVVERVSPVVMELAVEVPADTVKAEMERAFQNVQRKAKIRGFRPGKAPREVITRMFGPQIASDVVNAIVQGTLPKALTDKNVQPLNQPQVEPGKLDGTLAFSYKARFEVQPEIGEVVYEGLDLERPGETATEEAVSEQIELFRRQHARLQAPEPARPARKGDVVTIDFTLVVDGKEIKDGGGEGVQIELGASQVLPELDAALTGASVDAEKAVDATFPEAHPRKDLAGKAARLQVKVKDIKERILPAADDELAKDVGNFQTLVELRADVHTRLEKMITDRAESVLAEQIVDKLNEKNPVEVPPSLVEQQCRLMEMELMQRARRAGQNVSKDGFMKVHEQVHADAEKKVRAGLLMAAIAKKQSMAITDQDIERGMGELAAESGKNIAKIRVEYGEPQKRQMLIGMLLEEKVLQHIESKANISVKAAEK